MRVRMSKILVGFSRELRVRAVEWGRTGEKLEVGDGYL
jgi:hypothetical protein